jgi:hypothetical protein
MGHEANAMSQNEDTRESKSRKFNAVEAARLKAAGFVIDSGVARAEGASVEVTVDDDETCTITVRLLPGPGIVCLQFHRDGHELRQPH